MNKQKEYETDIMKVKWSLSRFVILAVSAVVNFFINTMAGAFGVMLGIFTIMAAIIEADETDTEKTVNGS